MVLGNSAARGERCWEILGSGVEKLWEPTLRRRRRCGRLGRRHVAGIDHRLITLFGIRNGIMLVTHVRSHELHGWRHPFARRDARQPMTGVGQAVADGCAMVAHASGILSVGSRLAVLYEPNLPIHDREHGVCLRFSCAVRFSTRGSSPRGPKFDPPLADHASDAVECSREVGSTRLVARGRGDSREVPTMWIRSTASETVLRGRGSKNTNSVRLSIHTQWLGCIRQAQKGNIGGYKGVDRQNHSGGVDYRAMWEQAPSLRPHVRCRRHRRHALLAVDRRLELREVVASRCGGSKTHAKFLNAQKGPYQCPRCRGSHL